MTYISIELLLILCATCKATIDVQVNIHICATFFPKINYSNYIMIQ